MSEESRNPRFIVLGAGIGGICSAIDLAEAGAMVTLVDKAPRTGGILPQLDHQFPDNHCGMCRLLPMVRRDANEQTCLKRGLFHDGIDILTRTTLTDLTGNPGSYTATLTTVSSGVDAYRCVRCMACVERCPVDVRDAFNDGTSRRTAIYRPFFGNPERLPTIDWENCTRCGACVDACPNGAVALDPSEKQRTLSPVAGVVVASGNDRFDPSTTDLYGYGILPNVMTATAFERLLSGSGPCRGKPVRPSDGGPIRRVAWIQCVGSRNVMIGAGHCSSVCCMFAVKAARLAKETLGPDAEATIFYMDMRTYGRDDQRFRDRAEKEMGVNFVRCRIHSVEPADGPGDLKLTYLDDAGQPIEAVFDLVVLSTGAGTCAPLAPCLEDQVDRGGVVTIGPQAGLASIQETVLNAHHAVSTLWHTLGIDATHFPLEIAGAGEAPAQSRLHERPAVVVILLDNRSVREPRIDWPALEAAVAGRLGVRKVQRVAVHAPEIPEDLTDAIDPKSANRLMIVANHLGSYRRVLEQALAGIGFPRELVDWVELNRDDLGMGQATTSVAAELRTVEASLSRLLHRRPQRSAGQAVQKSALVVGAGPAGLSAAVAMAQAGTAVHLVEQAAAIGGNGPLIRDENQRRPVEQLMAAAKRHPRITLHTAATLKSVSGTAGSFEGWIATADGELPVAFGAAIIATGGTVAPTEAYGLGTHPRLVNHLDFERRTLDPGFAETAVDSVVMIQCAGSREEPRNYCSRTCCVKSLENALRVRTLFPEARITVFYRDIMTEGIFEAVYADARARRIRFVPFQPSDPPVVRNDERRLSVDGYDPVLGETLTLEADWVSLAVGMSPSPVGDLCGLFSVPVTGDGFVAEADAKWRPVDTINPGVFVCGLARGPQRVADAIADGRAAALRAYRLLASRRLDVQRGSAVVRHAICSRCYLCIDACPYGARTVDGVSGEVRVDPAGCQGCGSCAAVCPNSATIVGPNAEVVLMNAFEAALK